ncbi:uncharacterized protein ACA1_381750 [Acanthamoeba castellanii str. Neff]|uniref:AttH domain-containing protein n=1 Tax=Acanthamoeba castellanii (strain ATCC 30010 / Neff) TaxID=1257118 RepID=L8GN88_ACACF|nr:uncharacterized protein ACA1_381750 [Acanthamoeba castellanii str. Neff]ELR14447.1 hypothetical protein ACA1_381750 [Acanthamoeba castellanii str. Neff]
MQEKEGKSEVVPYHWGRYKQALPLPDVAAPSWRLKQWHYHSINNGRWFVGMAIVNLGYLANAWVYLMDKQSRSTSCEYRALVPLSFGLSFADSSVEGTTSWKNRGNRMVIQADQGGYAVELHVTINGTVFDGRCTIAKPDESLALLYPLEGPTRRRAAYTHKAAGMPVEGSFRWGDEELRFTKADSFATMDWTRSHATRETTWKWASFAGDVSVGLNLSAEVYEAKENAFWLNGKVHLVGPVQFTLPARQRLTQDKWTLRSHNGALQLQFTPHAAREEHVHVGVIASEFSQVGGTFSGTIDVAALEGGSSPSNVVTIEDVLGVVETHYALW